MTMFQRMTKKRSAQSMAAAPGKMTITWLVCRKQWNMLEAILRQDSSAVPIDNSVNNPITGDLLVHFVCRFQAPTHIVRLVAKTYPESVQCVDALGRFPIHIACAWGASPETVQFLLGEYPVAASIQDNEGKVPIHHLCQSFELNYQDVSKSATDSMLSIIDMLKATAPNSFNLEDEDEMNAIEYALESDTDIKVIKTMQRACRDDWRDRKKEMEVPHETLQEDLQRMQMDFRNQHLSPSKSPKCVSESTGVPIDGQLEVKTHVARMA